LLKVETDADLMPSKFFKHQCTLLEKITSHHQHQINLIKFTILHQFCIVDVDMFSTTSLVLFLKGFYNFT